MDVSLEDIDAYALVHHFHVEWVRIRVPYRHLTVRSLPNPAGVAPAERLVELLALVRMCIHYEYVDFTGGIWPLHLTAFCPSSFYERAVDRLRDVPRSLPAAFSLPDRPFEDVRVDVAPLPFPGQPYDRVTRGAPVVVRDALPRYDVPAPGYEPPDPNAR